MSSEVMVFRSYIGDLWLLELLGPLKERMTRLLQGVLSNDLDW